MQKCQNDDNKFDLLSEYNVFREASTPFPFIWQGKKRACSNGEALNGTVPVLPISNAKLDPQNHAHVTSATGFQGVL